MPGPVAAPVENAHDPRRHAADTPLADLRHTAEDKRPDLVILAATATERFQHILPDLIPLAHTAPLRLAGAGATSDLADTIGATVLTDDPVTAAQRLTPPR